jgi:hypothetical protein
VFGAFDEGGNPRDPTADVGLGILLDDLAWWAALLQAGRADQLPPAGARVQVTATA